MSQGNSSGPHWFCGVNLCKSPLTLTFVKKLFGAIFIVDFVLVAEMDVKANPITFPSNFISSSSKSIFLHLLPKIIRGNDSVV